MRLKNRDGVNVKFSHSTNTAATKCGMPGGALKNSSRKTAVAANTAAVVVD